MMTSTEEDNAVELVSIIEEFSSRFANFRYIFVSAVWADLRSHAHGATTLLPRSAWTVAFLRTAGTVLTLNEHLTRDMKEVALKDLNGIELETVLLHFAPLFSVYTQYYESRKPFAELIRIRRKTMPGLEDLVLATEQRVGLKFEDILDLPLHQVTTMRGCINKRLGRATDDEETRQQLQPIADFLESIQTSINTIESRHASEALLAQIGSAWDVGPHVFAIKRPGRYVIKEGSLIKVSRKAEVQYQFVLFNDALIYGSKARGLSRKQFRLHHALDLSAVRVGVMAVGDEGIEVDTFATVPSVDHAVGGAVLSMLSTLSVERQNALRFNIYSLDGGKSFCVKAKTPGELCDWWITLSRTIAKYKKTLPKAKLDGQGKNVRVQQDDTVNDDADSAVDNVDDENDDEDDDEPCSPSSPSFKQIVSPVWQPDRTSRACTLCHVAFSTLRRRHHCYACGRLLCRNCSKFRGVRQVSDVAKQSSVRRLLRREASTGRNDRAQEKRVQDRTVRMCSQCYFASEQAEAEADRQAETIKGANSQLSPSQMAIFESFFGQKTSVTEAKAETAEVQSEPRSFGQNLPTDVLVALDLLNSEKSYLEGLRVLMKIYVRPLLDDFRSDALLIGGELVGIVDQADLSSMFVFLSDVQYIVALSERLIQSLQDHCISYSESGQPFLKGSIADVFLQMSALFQLYDEYSASFEFANRILVEKTHALSTLREFFERQKWVYHTALAKTGAQCIQSLLILPIQRLPRYILLLRRLRESMDQSNHECTRLDLAIDAIQRMTTHINERIRDREGLVHMHELVSVWGDMIIQEAPVNRKCIREGALVKQSRSRQTKYDFLLFTDALMYGEREEFPSLHVRHHRTIPLAYCHVNSVENDLTSFEIVSREKSFRVYAKDVVSCAAWIADLKDAIEKVREHRKSIQSETAPVWVKDTTNCMRCNIAFTMVIRPHHCRRCGKCLCNDCSPNRWLLEHVHPTIPQRVCLDCFGSLFATYGPPVLLSKAEKQLQISSPQLPMVPATFLTAKETADYGNIHETKVDEEEFQV